MSKNLVIVESPSKAKTINRYLGDNFIVLASYGHVRDLPAKNGSVNPDEDFSMRWDVDEKGKKHIKALSDALKTSENLYLATDPDREGEAISWHVKEIFNEKNLLKGKNVYRIVFNEITRSAITESLKSPRSINQDLVDAYLARRALDYLVGFTLSPVLWRKLPGARSAGRVQSVALRLIVEREQSIEAFKSQEYWSIEGIFENKEKNTFHAKLSHFNGKKLEKLTIGNSKEAQNILSTIEHKNFFVEKIEKKQVKRTPSPPFITSTLQQEASRKLGFSASRTMQVAQRLYEGLEIEGETTGLITYMRTDSVALSQEAIGSIREYLSHSFGQSYVPDKERLYKSKAKNAQEAHEAIRPTNIERTPKELAPFLDESQLKLYTLIWKRTLASQMSNALFDQVSVDLYNKETLSYFHATGSTQVFDGFLKVYQEGVDEGEDNKEATSLSKIPVLNKGDELNTLSMLPNQHFTQPPPRYTEASLVKKMEELGIGRPSTYAPLLQVLQDRHYVQLEKKQFIPQDRGRLVTSFLEHFFKHYVEYDFTAWLEEELDYVSAGERSWKEVLRGFWKDFIKNVEETNPLRVTEVINKLEEDLEHYLFNGTPKEERYCPKCKKGTLSLKLGKFGAFLGCSDYPNCSYTRPIGGQNNSGEETEETLSETILIGKDPQTNENIHIKKGPYGFYLQWDGASPTPEAEENLEKGKTKKKGKKSVPKPKRIGLPKDETIETLTLEKALFLKALPKKLGISAEEGEIYLGIGRFGPYLKYGDTFVALPKKESFFDVTLEKATAIIKEKKNKKTPLKSTSKKTKKAS